MSGLDDLSVKIFAIAGVLSILLLSLKKLVGEIEGVALLWIRAWTRIQAERKKQ